MKLSEIRDILNAKVLTGEEKLDELDVKNACGCDLMSDVLAFTHEKTLLLTGLVNPQVVRTAEVMGLIGLVFVRGKVPGKEVVEMAEKLGLPLLCTEYPLYETCGLLFQAGLGGCKYSKTGLNSTESE